MSCDLELIFGDLAHRVPVSADGNSSFIFSGKNLPVPPAEMQTDQLILTKAFHTWHPSWRVDAIRLQAHRHTCRQLGLLILSVVFHEQPVQVHLSLNHLASSIKHLYISYEYPTEHWGGYQRRPYAFSYSPQEAERHPWHYRPWSDTQLEFPVFTLTNRDDFIMTPQQWEERDTVRGCGSDAASVLFAELLLNAGRPENAAVEYQLEGEGGFRGVGVHSAEMQIFLPGSIGWDNEL